MIIYGPCMIIYGSYMGQGPGSTEPPPPMVYPLLRTGRSEHCRRSSALCPVAMFISASQECFVRAYILTCKHVKSKKGLIPIDATKPLQNVMKCNHCDNTLKEHMLHVIDIGSNSEYTLLLHITLEPIKPN